MPAPDYLKVDAYLRDAVGARALATAFELGVIDRLRGPGASPAMPAGIDAAGAGLLLEALRAHGVIEGEGPAPRLSPAFESALAHRELLEAKLAMLDVVGPDFLELFTALVSDPGRFQRSARLFELFSYGRAYEETPENLAHASRWVRFTTALTRHEAPPLLDAVDLSGVRRMLDVGGNSGEFALQACRRHPALRATVLDLPVVCALGERHVARADERDRVAFIRVAGEQAPFPAGHDLVAFKSMLHDWPDDDVRAFLRKARAALPSGGRLLVLERAAPVGGGFAWGDLPVVLFFRAYRTAEAYRVLLEEAGFRDLHFSSVELDMPFHVISAAA